MQRHKKLTLSPVLLSTRVMICILCSTKVICRKSLRVIFAHLQTWNDFQKKVREEEKLKLSFCLKAAINGQMRSLIAFMNDFMFELLKILLHCLVKIGRDLCRLNLFQGISAAIWE